MTRFFWASALEGGLLQGLALDHGWGWTITTPTPCSRSG
jgi:hypothetical protein